MAQEHLFKTVAEKIPDGRFVVRVSTENLETTPT
jgi:hypothetical protein